MPYSSEAELTLLRVRRFVAEFVGPAEYRARIPLDVEAWDVPDEPVPFFEAAKQDYTPVTAGARWGRPWSTTWFRARGVVPEHWSPGDGGVELLADLGFSATDPGFQAEGLVYDKTGRILKGLEPRAQSVPLRAGAGDAIDVFVEAAGNPDLASGILSFAPTLIGRKRTAGSAPAYELRGIDLGLLDWPVWELLQDIRTLDGLARELSAGHPRRAMIVAALDRMVDVVDPSDVSGTADEGRRALRGVLASPAAESAHHVIAVGHAHIDSAWLWPVRETVRKCARTFANVLALMDADPTLVFACSSAQQFAWMKDHYPELFERIRARVAEGRFVPVGGMWVESDTNMPNGESLVRQFVAGKRFFIEELGVEPREVWLPDSFGYTASLPQIALQAGARSFLTQKLSWNERNAFPRSTFLWEGIDGSRILTHFPPVSKYNSDLSAADLALAERNHAEKAQSNVSLVPFGFGDGGGGPTREMLAAARRAKSLEGSPRVTVAAPDVFFEAARAAQDEFHTWFGELYLEFHRGTYTSQARTKQGNRKSERLLHEAELWLTMASLLAGMEYPYVQLEEIWQTVLLQQFHDILPGSSIGWVHDQAVENYQRVEGQLETLIADALVALGRGRTDPVAFNSAPFSIGTIPAMGAAQAVVAEGSVEVTTTPAGTVLANTRLRVRIDDLGRIASIFDLQEGREVVPAGEAANALHLYRDTPRQWDAWDIDEEYRRHGHEITQLDSLEVVTDAGHRAVRVVRRFGDSSAEQTISLLPESPVIQVRTEVDWHERKKLLKLSFPVDVHASSATSEIQFGHIARPTHGNTSWDTARFETVAHRWVHVSDAAFGVGLANDSLYGHDVTRQRSAEGKSYSLIRQSLLRAPLYPDPEADQGRHTFTSSLVVGNIESTIREGYRLNLPLRHALGAPLEPLFTSESAHVVIETVKLAEDRSGDVIVRLYESLGAEARTKIRSSLEYLVVHRTDLLESKLAELTSVDQAVPLELWPFELVTLRFQRPLPADS